MHTNEDARKRDKNMKHFLKRENRKIQCLIMAVSNKVDHHLERSLQGSTNKYWNSQDFVVEDAALPSPPPSPDTSEPDDGPPLRRGCFANAKTQTSCADTQEKKQPQDGGPATE